MLSFDLEIAEDYVEGNYDVPISCAAAALDTGEIFRWAGKPQMTPEIAKVVVDRLEEVAAMGVEIVTWNGSAFDFRVLANACNDPEYKQKCRALSLNHIDMMFIVVCTKGHFLGLDKALGGQGLASKTHVVTLNDGTVLQDMSGAQAPKLWKEGQYDAVQKYLDGDVTQTLKLAERIKEQHCIRWISGSGKPQACWFNGFPTVSECLALPEPDVSWMTNPPKRENFVSW